jgi:hypothetical protein
MRKRTTRVAQRTIVAAAVVAMSFAGVGSSLAQPGPGTGRGKGARIYDPKTVETASGEVVSVEKTAKGRGRMGGGIHLMLKTDKETIAVHLGPSWYMAKQDVKIEPKDHIEVSGSRVTLQGKPAIVAAQVKKGDKVLKLREEDGSPLWSGRSGGSRGRMAPK